MCLGLLWIGGSGQTALYGACTVTQPEGVNPQTMQTFEVMRSSVSLFEIPAPAPAALSASLLHGARTFATKIPAATPAEVDGIIYIKTFFPGEFPILRMPDNLSSIYGLRKIVI